MVVPTAGLVLLLLASDDNLLIVLFAALHDLLYGLYESIALGLVLDVPVLALGLSKLLTRLLMVACCCDRDWK